MFPQIARVDRGSPASARTRAKVVLVEEPLLEGATQLADDKLDLHVLRQVGVVEVKLVHPRHVLLEHLPSAPRSSLRPARTVP
jgi:hypothetical protein